MSGGSQHNPNGRQSQLGSGWSPLQLQVANLLARAPQAHMASERGVTWHTPTPPPHHYHVPAPSPPDPLQGLLQFQAMKAAGGNSVFRHTATPPELYRHTPTPPDKHHMRHTPSPGDIKSSAALPPVELYPHLGPGRDKLVRADELLAYARGVDLSLSGGRAANGAPHSPAPPAPAPAPAPPALPPTPPALAPAAPPSLSVRDAPTINSMIARAQPRHPHARVDALLERLIPSPVSPHSVIMHSRAAPTPSPPSSNEDSADSCGAPPGSKRKRKPERTVRLPTAPPPPPAPPALPAPPAPRPAADADARVPPQRSPPRSPAAPAPAAAPAPTAAPAPAPAPPPLENGDVTHASPSPGRAPSPAAHARRKTRSGSAETIDDIAAMIAQPAAPLPMPPPAPAPAVTVDKLRSVLAGPSEPEPEPESAPAPAPAPAAVSPAPPSAPAPVLTVAAAPTSPPGPAPAPPAEAAAPAAGPAAAPRRRSARGSNADAPNVPVESPSEAKPAEPEASHARSAEPAAASFVEVENQLEKMFAGLEEEPPGAGAGAGAAPPEPSPAPPAKRRRSAPARHDRRPPRGHAAEGKKQQRKKAEARRPKKGGREASAKDAYDSGSNASSSRSRGPYIQIRGPRDSPLSVSVMNNTGCEEEETGSRRKLGEELRGARGARGLHASTLGLRYDATTPDATWLCAFCHRGPHADSLGDLFGPYALDTDCDEYRALDEATRRRYRGEAGEASEASAGAGVRDEVWLHEACGVWAPGLVAGGARLWGLAGAVWAARGQRCAHCAAPPAPLACAARTCRARAHLPCARAHAWTLSETDFRALCPHHAPPHHPAPAPP